MKEKFRSFSGRLTRRIIFVMLLTMTVVSGLVILFAAGGTIKLVNNHYEDVLKLTDERVTGVMKVVEMSTANNVDEIRQNLSRPELGGIRAEGRTAPEPPHRGLRRGFHS